MTLQKKCKVIFESFGNTIPMCWNDETGWVLIELNQGEHHLEIEIGPESEGSDTVEIFYRNRRTGDYWGIPE